MSDFFARLRKFYYLECEFNRVSSSPKLYVDFGEVIFSLGKAQKPVYPPEADMRIFVTKASGKSSRQNAIV